MAKGKRKTKKPASEYHEDKMVGGKKKGNPSGKNQRGYQGALEEEICSDFQADVNTEAQRMSRGARKVVQKLLQGRLRVRSSRAEVA